MSLKPSQASHFRFIIGEPPPDPSDFRFIMKKSLYKRFYTKTPNSATFDVENGHHSPFSCHSKFRLAIPRYLYSPPYRPLPIFLPHSVQKPTKQKNSPSNPKHLKQPTPRFQNHPVIFLLEPSEEFPLIH